MNKELYNWYKSNGICLRCKRVKAVPGKTMCRSCAGIIAVYEKSYNECHKEKRAAINKKRYEKRKAEHKCTDCGKPLPEEQTTFVCRECTTKRAKRKREKRKRQMYSTGVE